MVTINHKLLRAHAKLKFVLTILHNLLVDIHLNAQNTLEHLCPSTGSPCAHRIPENKTKKLFLLL